MLKLGVKAHVVIQIIVTQRTSMMESRSIATVVMMVSTVNRQNGSISCCGLLCLIGFIVLICFIAKNDRTCQNDPNSKYCFDDDTIHIMLIVIYVYGALLALPICCDILFCFGISECCFGLGECMDLVQ
jgi:hypothetical protein